MRMVVPWDMMMAVLSNHRLYPDYESFLVSHWPSKVCVYSNSRCRLPTALAALYSPQLVAAVVLGPSPYKVTLSNIPPFPNRGPLPLPPLSPVMEHRVDGDIAAEGEDGGGAGGPGSASNPGLCR
jgi:hypothetical protein